MGQLEDPDFTIKVAKVVTFYPGASAEEVQSEVTDVLETAIQQLPKLWRITSRSIDGISIITPEIKQAYTASEMPQIWDELRRKVGDAQSRLPPGARPSIVNDDFGDVFGVYLAIARDGFSYAALRDYADMLRRELLQVPGVASVALNGVQPEQIFIEVSRTRIAQMGIPLELVYQTIGEQNTVTDAGRVGGGDDPPDAALPVSARGDPLASRRCQGKREGCWGHGFCWPFWPLCCLGRSPRPW